MKKGYKTIGVIAYDSKTEQVVGVFDSCTDASNCLGVSKSAISNQLANSAIRGRKYQFAKYCEESETC